MEGGAHIAFKEKLGTNRGGSVLLNPSRPYHPMPSNSHEAKPFPATLDNYNVVLETSSSPNTLLIGP